MRTEYQGGGEVGRLADELARAEAEIARATRQHWRAWVSAEDDRSRPVAERAGRVRRAVGEALEGAGFHRHKRGEWRRRRGAMATTVAEMAGAIGVTTGAGGLPAVATAEADAIERRWLKRPAKVSDGDARALLDARPWLDPDNSLSPSFDLLATLLDSLNGDPVKREASRRKFFEVEAQLAGPGPTPTEALLAEDAALCWLDLNLRRARTAEAELAGMPPGVAACCQKRVDAAHRRFLAAVKTLAVVRKLAVPDLKVNFDGRSVHFNAPVPAIDVGPG